MATALRESTISAILEQADRLGPYRLVGPADTIVAGLVADSRAVTRNSIFCCVPGGRHDGHEFAAVAVGDGASVVVADRVLDLPVCQVIVPDVRLAIGPMACAVHGHPSRRIPVVGVTGTNGKTTTVHLVACILEGVGRPCGVLGTLTGRLTTPEAPELQSALAGFVAAGLSAAAMEVSSHSLELHRVDGTNFAVSVFTNLGRDHLDLHGSMEAYFEAKASLFVAGLGGTAVVNADDPWGRRLLERIDIPSIAYAASGLDDVSVGVDHHGYTWRGRRVHVPIGGAFNVSNSLAAATAVSALGVPDAEIVEALREVTPVPGRFESVDSGQAFHVIVDYAHTPDGLDAVLRTARTAVEDGRLSVVFGCGGDRDRDKRPLMGAVAAATADLVFVTSDNPRSEDPRAIMDEIVRGIPDVDRDRVMVEPDRAMAMEAAFRLARPGDVVVVAGKGHEITQTIGNTVLPFDDRVMARRILEALQ